MLFGRGKSIYRLIFGISCNIKDIYDKLVLQKEYSIMLGKGINILIYNIYLNLNFMNTKYL